MDRQNDSAISQSPAPAQSNGIVMNGGGNINTTPTNGSNDINSLRLQLRLAKHEIAALKAQQTTSRIAFGSTTPTGRLVTSPQPTSPVVSPPSPMLSTVSANGSVSSRPSSPSTQHEISKKPSLTLLSLPHPPLSAAPVAREGRRSVSPSARAHSPVADNPFFGGSGHSRDRIVASVASTSSGSGKVISGLQSDLIQARSTIDSTKSQLKLSQRAVEFLTKATDDLKETKERLTLENDTLSKILTRKERTLEESVSRHTVTTASLTALQSSHRLIISAHRSRLKELEELQSKGEDKCARIEAEYATLRSGIKSMNERWRTEMISLRSDLTKMEEVHRKELDEGRARCSKLTELYTTRNRDHLSLTDSLQAIQSSQAEFSSSFSKSIQDMVSDVASDRSKTEKSDARTKDMEREVNQVMRLMRAGERMRKQQSDAERVEADPADKSTLSRCLMENEMIVGEAR